MSEAPSTFPVSEIQHQTCASCRWFVANQKAEGKTGYCKARPPTPLMAKYVMQMESAMMPNGEMGHIQVMRGVVDGFFAPTAYDRDCGSYQRKGTNGAAPAGLMPLPTVPTVGETAPLQALPENPKGE